MKMMNKYGLPTAVRLHRAELAFFVFILLLAAVAVTLAILIQQVPVQADLREGAQVSTGLLKQGLVASLVISGTAIAFGLFYIYPLIRSQVREEDNLREMTKSLSARSETLEQAALTDALTGMYNRRYFDDALKEYLDEFGRIDRPVGLMVLDLDHFKQVNDTHGHDVGDDVLKAVAGCLRDFTRYHDVVARLGGEEFAIVAPNMDVDQLVKFADRIRQAVASLTIASGNIRLRVTTSVGVAVWDRRENGDDFYRRADRMLYQAKRQGRNRVCA